MKAGKISPWVAILININIVIGAAFFLSAPEIARTLGVYAPGMWALYGLLLLPLKLVFFHLARRYPEAGGVFVYSYHALGPLFGFISGWGYFVGTVAGNAAILIAFTEQLTGFLGLNMSWGLSVIPGALVVLFTVLSLFNVAWLERLQIGFVVLKIIPFVVLCIGAFLLADRNHLVAQDYSFEGMVTSLPLILFSYIGLEACCAVIDKIKGPASRASRVILSSFAIIAVIYIIAQSCILVAFGRENVDPFMSVLPSIFHNGLLVVWGNCLIKLSILLSFLGGFYGMFYYNNWNLYAIAQSGNCIGASSLLRLNHNQAPWVCIIGQSLITLMLLVVLHNKAHFVVMSDIGITIAYILSTLAYIVLYKRSVIGWAALGVCIVFTLFCGHSLASASWIAPLLFLLLLGLGGALYQPSQKSS